MFKLTLQGSQATFKSKGLNLANISVMQDWSGTVVLPSPGVPGVQATPPATILINTLRETYGGTTQGTPDGNGITPISFFPQDCMEIVGSLTNGTSFYNIAQNLPALYMANAADWATMSSAPTVTYGGVVFRYATVPQNNPFPDSIPNNPVLVAQATASAAATATTLAAFINLVGAGYGLVSGSIAPIAFPSWIGAGPIFTAVASGAAVTVTLGTVWTTYKAYFNAGENFNGGYNTPLSCNLNIRFPQDSFTPVYGYNGGVYGLTGGFYSSNFAHQSFLGSFSFTAPPVSTTNFPAMGGVDSNSIAALQAVWQTLPIPPILGQPVWAFLTGQRLDDGANVLNPSTDTTNSGKYTMKLFEVSRKDDLKHAITAKGNLGLHDRDADDLTNPPPIAQFRLDAVYGVDTTTGQNLPNPNHDHDPLTNDNFFGCQDKDPINYYPGESRHYLAMALSPAKYASGVLQLEYSGVMNHTVGLQAVVRPSTSAAALTPSFSGESGNYSDDFAGISWPVADETIEGHDTFDFNLDIQDLAVIFQAQVQGQGTFTLSIPFTITSV